MRAWLVAAVLLSACGDDDAPSGADAGADAGSGLAVAPDIPWLADGRPPVAPPMLTPCPEGWREVVDGDVVTCDPYPEAGPAACGPGEAHFPGEASCTLVGDPCPAGDFAEGLPTDGTVIYVRAGATGGDGSLAAPFGALADVPWSLRGTGWTVALARGTYAGTIPMRGGVRVVGACAAETILTGAAGTMGPVAFVARDGDVAELANLSIVDPPQGGCAAPMGSLRLRGVVVEGALGFGVGAQNGGEVDAESVVVRGTQRASGSAGAGVLALTGARMTIARAVVEASAEDAIVSAEAGTTVSASRVLLRGNDKTGLAALRGGSITADRVLAVQNREVAMLAWRGGTMALEDVILRDTRETTSGTDGRGLLALDGGVIEATRVVAEGNRYVGIGADLAGSRLLLSDAVIRDTTVRSSDGTGGRGLAAQVGAVLDASRVALLRNTSEAVFAGGDGAALTLGDAVVRDTRSGPSGLDGRGIAVEMGARVEATRALLENERDFAVFVGAASATLTDVAIRDTSANEVGRFGVALGVQGGGNAMVSRALFERQHDLGVFVVQDGSHATLADVVLRDTESVVATGEFGHGVHVQGNASATLSRARIERSRGSGVLSTSGSSVMLENVVIESVAPWACADATCADTPFGYGLSAIDGTIVARGLEVRGASLCGLFLANGASMDVSMGEVSGSPIGACVQVDGYDLGRLSTDVTYVDNDVNLDATSLPVPQPIEL